MDDYKPPAAMKRVGDLFERYRTRFKAPQASVEKACIEIIKAQTGFELQPSQVGYTVGTRTLSLQVPSILKTEILFKKTTLLEQFSLQLGADSAPKYLR